MSFVNKDYTEQEIEDFEKKLGPPLKTIWDNYYDWEKIIKNIPAVVQPTINTAKMAELAKKIKNSEIRNSELYRSWKQMYDFLSNLYSNIGSQIVSVDWSAIDGAGKNFDGTITTPYKITGVKFDEELEKILTVMFEAAEKVAESLEDNQASIPAPKPKTNSILRETKEEIEQETDFGKIDDTLSSLVI